MTVQTVPTPALVIDAAAVRRNIDRLARYTSAHGLKIRPHTKTHKSKKMAQLQIAAGVSGLTVAKVGEAEQMAEVHDDLLLAYPAVDPARTTRLAELARRRTIRVAVDTAIAAEAVAAAASAAGVTIGLLADIDVGMHRTGVASPADLLALARHITGLRGIRLDGIMCYPGHIWTPADQQAPLLAAVAAILEESIDLWRRSGLAAPIVSGGSTPTAYQSHLVKPYTEIRPGTYIYNDMNTLRGGWCAMEDCAARIVCTVVSDAVKNQIVLDGGTKTLTSDRSLIAPDSGHGLIVEYPQAKITRLSEEHAQVDVSGCDQRPRVGQRVTVIPNHICPCVNLQDAAWWQEEGRLTRLPIDARGRLS